MHEWLRGRSVDETSAQRRKIVGNAVRRSAEPAGNGFCELPHTFDSHK